MMTLLLRIQRAQDRIKGRYSFDWGEDDYAVVDETQAVDERQIGRIYKERVPEGVKWLWSLQVARAPPRTRASPIRSMRRRWLSLNVMRR